MDPVVLAVLGITATAAVGSLYAVAALIRNHAEAHDLKVRVASLRLAYFRRIQAQNEAGTEGEVDVVDKESAPAPAPAPAAREPAKAA